MLVTFHCKNYHDVVFFGDIALKLLHCMGHSGEIPGAILANDVSQALALLRQSVQLEKEKPVLSADEKEPAVRLANRAQPLIELLECAFKQQSHVMWDSNVSIRQ